MSTMRITVFGGTGRTGRHVLEQGARRGHEVLALVRSPDKVTPHEGLTVVAGDAFDRDQVRAAIEGADAVISALGAAGLGPTTDLSTMNANVVAGAEAAGVQRVAVILSVGVFFEEAQPPFEHVVAEHKRDLATLRASSLGAWVGACPPDIVDEPATGTYRAVLDGRGPAWRIPTGDLATFLLDAVDTDAYAGHPVGVSGEEAP
jgi:putative NADH-flavin reductase